MKKEVFMLKKEAGNKFLGEGWYYFYDISAQDILKFALEQEEKIYVSVDPDPDKVLKKSNVLLKRNTKHKLRNNYLLKYGNNFYFSVNRNSNINAINKKVGDILIFSESQTLEIVSEKELFNLAKIKVFCDNLYFKFFFAVHDFDWITAAYFKEESIFNDFIAFIEKHATLITGDLSGLSKRYPAITLLALSLKNK